MLSALKRELKRTPLYWKFWRNRAVREAAQWTPRDEKMLDFYRQFIRPGELCFDIGANVGNRVKIFLRLGAKVVAVEPQPQCGRVLQAAFGSNPSFTLVQAALGAKEGSEVMMLSEGTTLSSLSPQWVKAVRESGRFGRVSWGASQQVRVTTVDRLIESHGAPAFMKIDVEGYEFEVLSGLTRPAGAFSLEFTPEWADKSIQCIRCAMSLGSVIWNFSEGESMKLAYSPWISDERLLEMIESRRHDAVFFGDFYGKFVNA